MKPETVAQLLALNRQFYQEFGRQFAETRQRLQPGVSRLLRGISPSARILDLGCGSGVLAQALARQQHLGEYIGLDSSQALLEVARRGSAQLPDAVFIQVDLAMVGWGKTLPPGNFDVICAFAVLHHLPSAHLRHQVLWSVRRLLRPSGLFYHSNWQFLNSPRLRRRLQPWETIGLSSSDVEANDYLLDWRHGGQGLRYVHHFSVTELASLAAETGFIIRDSFLSDGQGGTLGLYQVWQ